MTTPSETGEGKADEKPAAEMPASAPAIEADSPKPASKPMIGRTAAVGIGIGSAALVAALLYASRSKSDRKA